MDLVSAPIEDQLAAFKQMVMTNAVVATLIERLPQLEVPGCYLAAGALYQTVWNCLCKRDPRAGINDYDINYFDATDLTWEAEDAVIRRGADLFGDLDATVEIRNEARVHVWYEDKFGVPCPAFSSTERTSSRNATERSERRQSCRRRRKHFRPSPAQRGCHRAPPRTTGCRPRRASRCNARPFASSTKRTFCSLVEFPSMRAGPVGATSRDVLRYADSREHGANPS